MHTNGSQVLFLTGTTGFIGHYLLTELLRRQYRCVVLLRPPVGRTLDRLAGLLAELGLDAAACAKRECLIPVEGDLGEDWPDLSEPRINAVVHCAASTRFHPDKDGDPHRTNVLGTERLLDWASGRGIEQLHLVSSAYTCGRACAPVAEELSADQPRFHNAYEESKWQAERLCVAWAERGQRRLTMFRPSVVVGEYGSGRATKFSGFYVLARATEFLDRAMRDADAAARRALALRIKARPGDCQNIVPVDYVAAMVAHIIDSVHLHGRTYHLVHPRPPTNELIKTSFEEHFGLGGGRFVAPEEFPMDGLNEHEQRFYEISRSIEHYFVDTPTFLRSNADAVGQEAGIICPAYDPQAIRRLVSYAQSVEWGRRRNTADRQASPCAVYFESFLPKHIGRSQVARLTSVTATMRFVIEDEPNGEWVCVFDRGRLSTVRRGHDGIHEDFGYRATREVFWQAISGNTHPQELFLTGRAEVFGNVERALKMAVILHAFTKECPCDAKSLCQMRE
jgi:nucleoside-diphosphate-sugar epimerase